MLNYEELDRQVDEILAKISRDDLESWFAFDVQREMLDRLQEGEAVIIRHSIKVTKLVDAQSRETFQFESLSGDTYALAA